MEQLWSRNDFLFVNLEISFAQVVTVAGHRARAIRLSFVGELGWELHIPNESAKAVYQSVMEAGKQFGIVNAGYRAIDSLSIEKGLLINNISLSLRISLFSVAEYYRDNYRVVGFFISFSFYYLFCLFSGNRLKMYSIEGFNFIADRSSIFKIEFQKFYCHLLYVTSLLWFVRSNLDLCFSGYRHWHADLRSDDTPLEAGLEFTCKLKTNFQFLGREAIEKQKKEGLRKRLACFTIDEYVCTNWHRS